MLQELNEEEEWLLEMLQKCRLLCDQKVEVRSLQNTSTRLSYIIHQRVPQWLHTNLALLKRR